MVRVENIASANAVLAGIEIFATTNLVHLNTELYIFFGQLYIFSSFEKKVERLLYNNAKISLFSNTSLFAPFIPAWNIAAANSVD